MNKATIINAACRSRQPRLFSLILVALNLLALTAPMLHGALAPLLFEDNFDRGIPGWTPIQPTGNYIDGPMRWRYDVVSGAWVEHSNIYTDGAAASPTATAVMLINDAEAPVIFSYSARFVTGDDDGFGLIFGYQDDINFYRVTFNRQSNSQRRSGEFPGYGWQVDRKQNGQRTILFGSGTVGGGTSFINRSGIPFDVRITVTSGHRFSLSVVDDPDGVRRSINLVANRPLPGAAGGKVGLMSWGMSGTTVRGFQALNLNLSPVALVNYPPNPLPGWIHVIPPREGGDNSLNNHRTGLWSLPLGQTGPTGRLQESSDSSGGNDSSGRVDYVASSMIAGDVGWTNYLLRARLTPRDDDGMGVLLRFQNATHFYRIGFRSQNSSIGMRSGLSIQKVVAGDFEEIYFDNANTRFNPTPDETFEVLAAIRENQLRVLVIRDPEGDAEPFSYGPFDMAGGSGLTVDRGRIGLFSWGMNDSEFDYVKVEHVDGLPIEIRSPYGIASPQVGLHDLPEGSSVTAHIDPVTTSIPGVRRISTGFTGIGSVPSRGTSNSVTFVLNEISRIEWTWRTEYQLRVTASEGGVITSATNQWLAPGSQATITASAKPGYLFAGWSSSPLTSPSITVHMTQPRNLMALFKRDSDRDGLPDDFEQTYFGTLDQNGDDDADNDGRTNREEFENHTDPKFMESVVSEFGLPSSFENVQRDPALPGRFEVKDFGNGFRGAHEDSNDFRSALDPTVIGQPNLVRNVSFQGPRLMIDDALWNPGWSNFSARAVISVGDDDGNCVYWRYQNESNWYRVTITGSAEGSSGVRPPFGVSIQKRTGNTFRELDRNRNFVTGPTAFSGWDRIQVTVIANGADHTVILQGWDVSTQPHQWSSASKTILQFTDAGLAHGRFGVGSWGQGFNSATPSSAVPVEDGILIEEVEIQVEGNSVFREDWSNAPLSDEFPPGWTNPFSGFGNLEGDWRMSAHGTIMQLFDFGPFTSSSATKGRADVDGPILLAPDPGVPNYQLSLGFHPFDDDAIGFVYDFVDTNNYARVLFASQASGEGRVPQGLTVSRKSAGVWSEIFVGDLAFIYRPGHPFAIEFANNNGQHGLKVWEVDDPDTVHTWEWSDRRPTVGNQFGLTVWSEEDAHFLYVRALELPDNLPPLAQDDAFEGLEDQPLSGMLNGTDPDGDSLAWQLHTAPAQGDLVIQNDGTFTYVPPTNFNGVATFQVAAGDGSRFSLPATITLTVIPVNDAPSFQKGDDITVLEDSGLHSLVNWATGMSPGPIDEAGQSLRFEARAADPALLLEGPTLSRDGTLSFVTASNAHGSTTIMMRLKDDGGTANGGVDASGFQSVQLTLLPVNDRPTVEPVSVSVKEDDSVTFTLAGHDVDGDRLVYEAVTSPMHGALSGDGSAAWTYQPALNYHGPDQWRYRVSDGLLYSEEATVVIRVVPINDAPVPVIRVSPLTSLRPNQSRQLIISQNNTNAVVQLDGTESSDVEGDPLEFAWFEEGAAIPFAFEEAVEVVLNIGLHRILLTIDDGMDAGTASTVFEIITAGLAIEEVILEIVDSPLEVNRKRPLIGTLKNAAAAFDRGRFNSGINQLNAFQKKTTAQVMRTNPDLAKQWIEATQRIIDRVSSQ